jgi:hypothetical protein
VGLAARDRKLTPAGEDPTNGPPAARPPALSLRHGRDGLPIWKYAMPTEGFRTARARAAGPGRPGPPSAQASDSWLPLQSGNVRRTKNGSMRPTGATEDRTWLYRSGEAESKERQRMFRVLPNGPGIELPAAREGTMPRPAGARRVDPEPGGRRLEALAGRPCGGRSAPMPCWAARSLTREEAKRTPRQ